MIIENDAMCCCLCGHIADVGAAYETERPDGDEGGEFPICHECGEWNTGGYQSYAKADIWSGEVLEYIKELNS